MKAILIIGQSNNHYGDSLDSAVDFTATNVLQWPLSGSYVGKAVLAAEPLYYHDPQTGKIGHALGLAKMLADDGERRIIIPAAYGGKGFTGTPSWIAGQGLAEDAVGAALACLEATGAVLEGVVFNGSQTDVDSAVAAETLQGYLDDLEAYLRTNIPGDWWFIVEGYQPEYLANVGGTEINAVLAASPHRYARCAFVAGIEGVTAGDDTHYTAAGHRLLARAVYQAVPFARANVNTTGDGPAGSITNLPGTTSGGGEDPPPDPPPEGAFTIASYTLTTNAAGNAGYALRTAVTALGQAAAQIRVTFKASSSEAWTVAHASVGVQSSGPDTVSTPVELLFSAESGFSIAAGMEITSDWATVNMSSGNVPVIDMDIASGNPKFLPSGGVGSWYNISTPAYQTADVAGTADGTAVYGIVLVEGYNPA